jgi:phage-related minor tail protein
MKALIIALFVTVAVSASLDNVHFHFHVDRPVSDKRLNGFVSNLVNSFVNKGQKDIDIHLHLGESGGSYSEDELEDFGFGDIFNPIKNVVDKAKDGIGKAIDGVQKGFDITKSGINVAISKSQDAFNKVKNEIQSIRLPPINIPNLVEPIINIAKIAVRLIPCALTLKKAIPNMIGFAKAAAANSAAEAVRQLLGLLQYMPEITEKCLNKVFTIPPKVMSKIQCGADIVALAAIVIQFIVFPENVIGNIQGLQSMIELIPATISDCTGAFN